jgi:L-aminopeptidase/D-esterase-like protein
MTGTAWIEEAGFLEGPIAITNTHSVGVVRDAIIAWQIANGLLTQPWSLPVVAETWDGYLNDINGFHVKAEHVYAALAEANTAAVAEGNVGGGTGMICYGFKGGIGTASRRLAAQDGGYTVGVLVQANFGGRKQLRIEGAPVGEELAQSLGPGGRPDQQVGSIIVVVATDAPLLPHQLKRVARRASLGIARTGGTSSHGSGDIFVAFSTANPRAASSAPVAEVQMLAPSGIDALFDGTVYATEEAIINALFAAETMVGRDERRIEALPQDRVMEALGRGGGRAGGVS